MSNLEILMLIGLGVHTAREEDDAEGYHTDKLGGLHVGKLYAEAIAAEEHSHEEEEQQGGHTEACTGLAHGNAHEEQHGAYKENISGGEEGHDR